MTSVARDHLGLEVLTLDECRSLLTTTEIGRVAFMKAGNAMVFPVTYQYAGGRVVFMSAVGSKLDAAAIRKPVAFETDHWDPSTKTGWSVVVTGTLRIVPDSELPRVKALDLVSWVKTDAEMQTVEIIPDLVTGRRLG